MPTFPHDEHPYSWRKEHTEMPEYTFPVNVFHIYFPDRFIIPPHWHDHLEWILITKGSFQVQVGSASKVLQEGEAAWINRRQIHCAYPTEEGSELYAVVYNETLLSGMQDYTETRYIRPLLAGELALPAFFGRQHPVTGLVRSSLERLIALHNNKGAGYELCMKGELLCSLGAAFQMAGHEPVKPPAEQEKGIHQLLLHLGSHFQDPLTVKEAARICCVTPTYFCYLFKKTTGKTLVEYMHMLRIHEAARLLRLPRYPVQEVANRTGFSNATYFGRIFKKYTGMTPRAYRAHSMNRP